MIGDGGRCYTIIATNLGTAKEHNKATTPTINPNDRQSAQITDTVLVVCHQAMCRIRPCAMLRLQLVWQCQC